MARLTGLEPATPGVTGRYSNQLSYNRPPRRESRHKKMPQYFAGIVGNHNAFENLFF